MRVKKIYLISGTAILFLMGSLIAQAFLLFTGLQAEREKFNEKVASLLLDMHHTMEAKSAFGDMVYTFVSNVENGENPSSDLIKQLKYNFEIKMDSLCTDYGINLDYDFVIFDSRSNKLLLTSNDRSKYGKKPKFHISAGYRVGDVYGRNVYRFGLFYHNQFGYLMERVSIYLLLSIIFIIGLGLVFYSIMRSIRKMHQLADMKNDFINNLTHELKTPIFSMSMIISMLKKKLTNNNEKKVEEYLEILENENNHLKSHVEKVMELSEFESKEIKLNKTQSDVHQIILSNKGLFDVWANEKRGKVEFQLIAKNTYIKVDYIHINNVLQNLVDNAFKYSNKPPKIKISTLDVINGIEIHVADNGIGVKKEDRKLIFNKFYRVTTGNLHRVNGFGLGLSYVKMIVEAHGGNVGVDESSEGGSCFKIYLPN